MTNLKRIESNLLNAQRSTGPKTHKGKAIASMNAEKHGILSKETLINIESIHDLNEFAEAMKLSLAPEGQFEALLVDRIVSSAWRLRRIIRVEAQILDEKPDMILMIPKYLLTRLKMRMAIACQFYQDMKPH